MIKVKIYTKDYCPACMMTKKLFNPDNIKEVASYYGQSIN